MCVYNVQLQTHFGAFIIRFGLNTIPYTELTIYYVMRTIQGVTEIIIICYAM